jgi:hypothetical protein
MPTFYNMTRFLKYFAVAAGIAGLVTSATAVPTLYLSDGVNSVTVVDGGIGDSSPLAGVVTFNGSIGLNWTLNVTTGVSKPMLGSATQPWMDLNSVNATSKGAGSLTIMLSDNGFGPASGKLTSKIGGTTQGKVTMKTYKDAGNGIFALSTPLTSQGAFGTGLSTTAFASTASMSFSGALPFSLTEVATITHTRKAISSFNEELRVPDAGWTLALLGSSLLGLAAFARTRKTA